MPYRKVKPWGKQKPPPGTPINWGHPLSQGLFAVWLFNEGGGRVLNNAVGTPFNGSIVTLANTLWKSGLYGPALFHSSATTDAVTFPSITTGTTWTWLTWVNSAGNPGASNYQNLFANQGNPGIFLLNTAGIDNLDYYYTNTDHKSTSSIPRNKWNMLVITVNAGTVQMYINGIKDASFLSATSFTPNGMLQDNTGSPVEGFNGYCSHQMFWKNRVLTFLEIRQLSQEPFGMFIAPSRRIISQVASGILFDAASNSGDQAASGNYTFNRTVTGSNTFLAVDVELLTVTGATVTSVTDDDGGGNVSMKFLGAKSTVTGAGRVECWGLAAPTTGTKAIRVILSASIESAATAVSYTGVHQTSSTEGFNSAQATNVGAADASVAITSVADNCWIHAACVSDDTTITANQTTRNNISGTLGSGADEDTGPITPAGATTMSYTNIAGLKTWAIAGYAIRPVAAGALGNTSNFFSLF